MLFNDYVSNIPTNYIYISLLLSQKNVKTIIFSELPQQDKIKYFNFLLENDINFSRDESGNYVALVKVLNPAFYGGNDTNLNPSISSKKELAKKETKNIPSEPKKEEGKLRGEKKSGQNASKSIPKNISDKSKYGDNKGSKWDYSNNSGMSYGYNNSINSKKKNAHKSTEHFEKEKVKVRKIILIYILFIYRYKKKTFQICQKVDIKNSSNQ